MVLADNSGLPLCVVIADGSKHDVVLTDLTLDAAFVDVLPGRLIGDKAWDSQKLQHALYEQRYIKLIAPLRGGSRPSKRKQDGRTFRRYRRRWLVERLFAWLKAFRRLALRWESKSENFLGFLQLGCVVIFLRRCWQK